MSALACLNGNWSAPEEARVSIWDRGFLFGDSVYEVLRVYHGHPWLEEAHFERLRNSLAAIRLEGIDLGAVRETCHEAILRSKLKEATLYIQITRGAAPRRHAFPRPAVEPTILVVIQPYDDGPTQVLRETGVVVAVLPDMRWGRCDIKSTNLLANILANEEAHEAGAYEAILVDKQGNVTEATHSSLLWVRGGQVSGTPEGPEILPGTSRHHVRKLIEGEGGVLHEESISLSELEAADEVILLGTTLEVMPVVRVGSTPIASGRPGETSLKLQQMFQSALKGWLKTATRARGR